MTLCPLELALLALPAVLLLLARPSFSKTEVCVAGRDSVSCEAGVTNPILDPSFGEWWTFCHVLAGTGVSVPEGMLLLNAAAADLGRSQSRYLGPVAESGLEERRTPYLVYSGSMSFTTSCGGWGSAAASIAFALSMHCEATWEARCTRAARWTQQK